MKAQAAALLLLIATSTATFSDVGDVRIVTLTKSWHYDSKDKDEDEPRQYNENQKGIGIEIGIDRYTWIGYLRFSNSFYRDSRMINLHYERPLDNNFYIGGMFGFSDGYDRIKNNRKKDPHQGFAGVTVRWKFIRFTITPVVAGVGIIVDIK